MTILKKISNLITVAGIPSTVIGLIGDFFSPKGGWIVVGAVGVTALIIAALLLSYISIRGESFKQSWLYKLTSNDQELSWIWDAKHPILAHGIHVALLFGGLCVLISGKSFASAEDGGIMAKNLDSLKAAQVKIGLLDGINQEQKKTNENLTRLNKTAEGLKQETSSDPRKELQNLGLKFDFNDFEKSIRRNDIRALDLYRKEGFKLSNNVEFKIIYRQIQDSQITYMTLLLQDDKVDCTAVLNDLSFLEKKSDDKSRLLLLSKICNSSANKDFLKDQIEEESSNYKKSLELLKKWDAEKPINEKILAACIRKLSTDAGVLFGKNCQHLERPTLGENARKERLESLLKIIS